ncbi:MAG TPA: hypothetical protein VGH02_00015 [Rhizomicrobium sp.]|jgi:hypothetical protein
MTRVAAVLVAFLITGVMVFAVIEGVSSLMTSRAVWAVVRSPWFQPSIFVFNGLWVSIWLPFYISYANRKKAETPKAFRLH